MLLCDRHAALSWQQAVNESDQTWPSVDAHTLLTASGETGIFGDMSDGSLIIERINKPHRSSPCVRIMTDLPEVSYMQHSACSYFCPLPTDYRKCLLFLEVEKKKSMLSYSHIQIPCRQQYERISTVAG